MLTAVPAQSQPVSSASHREEAFRRAVEDALTSLSGQEAVDQIVRLYVGDTRALTSRSEGSAREASVAARDSRRHWEMLLQVQTAASQGIWERAKLSAEVATFRSMFDTVRQMADRADGQSIDPADLSAALSIEPMPSVHPAVTVAFLPSNQFRGGQFLSTPEGDVTFVFTFVGWALIDHGPGALGCVEPMFLVEDRALSRSTIEHERRVRLERFLPSLEPLRASA